MNNAQQVRIFFSVLTLHGLFLFLLSFLGDPPPPPKVPLKVQVITLNESPDKTFFVEERKSSPPLKKQPSPLPVIEEETETVKKAPASIKEEKKQPSIIEVAPEEPPFSPPIQEEKPLPPPPPPPPKEKPKVIEAKKEPSSKPKVENVKKPVTPPKKPSESVAVKPKTQTPPSKPTPKSTSIPSKTAPPPKHTSLKPVVSSNTSTSKSSPVPSKPSASKANQEKLLAMMQSSLAQIEGCEKKSAQISQGSGKTSGSSKTGTGKGSSLPALKSENIVISGGPPSYANELVIYLKHRLTLPEKGDLRIRLSLSGKGKVSSLTILSSSSDKNRSYVEKMVPTLSFPSLPELKDESFLLTLKGD